MAGTMAGGQRAAATNKRKHGRDFYKRIGALGGKAGRTGGFAVNAPCVCSMIEGKHYRQHCAGVKGGRISRRGPSKSKATEAKR